MSNIRADLCLCPIRFIFLVRPDDVKRTLEIFSKLTLAYGVGSSIQLYLILNACQYGGKETAINLKTLSK